ncbi:MAG: hypothetical protein CL840_19975 [Crocinitomicaceae bacterium]|nr:hypothetical protein [Crocinitomicaceae bacterium]|tara:strand:- start:22715 stop:25582 length:2868 start_codon:yes stop_codon:yes gene_type:complete
MKKSLLNLFGIISLVFMVNTVFAQTPYLPPDKDGESPSNAMVYIKNQGQLLDNTETERNDVRYYVPNSTPAVYAMEDRVSLVALELDSLPPDTIGGDSILNDSAISYRIDMQFLIEGSPQTVAPIPVEQVGHNYNYYLSHLTGGSLTNVPAYDRIVYEDVWTGIDVHLTTNLVAPKMYFVVHPNADPDDINLGFTGQDDIDILSTGELEFDLNDQVIQLPELEAYEVDPTTDQITSLNWMPAWQNPSSGSTVTVTTGTYDTDNYLVLVASKKSGQLAAATLPGNILNWSTYAGTQGFDSFEDLAHDPNSNDDVVAVGKTGNNYFAQTAGVNLTHANGADGIVTKFDKDGELQWVAYYGTSGVDFIEKVAINSSGDIYFYATVSNRSTPVFEPSSGTFNVTTQYGASKYFHRVLGSIKKSGDQLLWATYFGNDNAASGRTRVNSMVFDNNDILYLVGQTTQNPGNLSFPITARSGTNVYNQSAFGGGGANLSDGFIARFNTSLDLTWLTYYGGSGRDVITDITVNPDNDIFFVGYTASNNPTYPTHCKAPTTIGEFPVCNTLNGGTVLRSFVYQGGIYDGFVAQILANGQLNWSRYMGGAQQDVLQAIACNNTSDDTKAYYISVGGNTNGNDIELDCDLGLAGGKFCKDKIIVQAGTPTPPVLEQEVFITKFDASFDISYATYVGGEKEDVLMQLVADENNNLVGFASTYSVIHSPDPDECKGSIMTQSSNLGISYKIPVCPGLIMDPIQGTFYMGKTYYGVNGNGLHNMYVEFPNHNHRGYLFRIDDDERMVWATMFGASTLRYPIGFSQSFNAGMTLTGNGDLYVAQKEESQAFPIYKPNTKAHVAFGQGAQDAFISKFANLMGQNLIASMKHIEPEGGELILFPNPSGTQSILKSSGENIERYSIYDVSGKLIEKKESNSNEVEIDVSGKSQGIYFIEAETEKKVETKKLIVR